MAQKTIVYTQEYLDHEVTDEFYDGEWHKTRKPKKLTSKPNRRPTCKGVTRGTGKWAAKGGVDAVDLMLQRNGIGAAASSSVSRHETKPAEAHVAELAKLKVLAVDAGARALHASASASATPVGANASAKANVAEAEANAALVEGVLEANARAVYAEAAAHAGFGLKHLGAYAGAGVTIAKVTAGISNTPLQVSAQGPGADAEAGVSWKYTGASVGAYAGEARAGPFAARAGVKFGAGVRNGVPEVDLGPVTVPCSVM